MLAARFHAGLDLTREKRFTLSPPTKKLLRRMDDFAVVDVMLGAKISLPGFSGFRNLSASGSSPSAMHPAER